MSISAPQFCESRRNSGTKIDKLSTSFRRLCVSRGCDATCRALRLRVDVIFVETTLNRYDDFAVGLQALGRDDLSGKEVSRFIRVWLQQREMVHSGAHVVELTMLLNLLVLTLTLVLCTYNTMYIVLNGFSELGIFLSSVGFLTGITVFRLFNLGHVVNQQVGQSQIASTRISVVT